MANEKMRIIQLPTAPQVEDNDYLAIDNTSTPTAENEGGTRKILVKDITAKSADAVEYDNTTSGLEADNVQDAIDEVSNKSAEDVPYDNSDSGLESEDVQSAIDEIADVLGALKVEGTVENQSIATFTDGSALPMPKLEVAVEPQQSGSGDPSPTNIRPISGWSAVDVTIQDDIDNPTTTETITIQLGDTYYGGKLDVVSGVLTVDRAFVDLGTLNWTYLTSGSGLAPYFYADITSLGIKYEGNFGTVVYPVLCSIYKTVNRNISVFIDNTLCMDGAIAEQIVTQVQIKDSRYTSASDFKTAMNGVQLVYELATPTTIQLTPTQVNSLMGVNNIWADCGKINKAVYIRDLNIVINNLLNA